MCFDFSNIKAEGKKQIRCSQNVESDSYAATNVTELDICEILIISKRYVDFFFSLSLLVRT